MNSNRRQPGTGHRRAVFESTPACGYSIRGREVAAAGGGSHPALAAAGLGDVEDFT